MLNRRFFIIIGVLLMAILCALVYRNFFMAPASSSEDNTGTATTSSSPSGLPVMPLAAGSYPTSTTLSFGTAKGVVVVNNFYPTAVGIDADTVLVANSPAYQILYDIGTSAFSLMIQARPNAQADGEAKFLQILGISKTDACKLTVSETGTGNSGLSFCSTGAFGQ